MGGADQTIRMSKQYKGSFADKLRQKQIKLQEPFDRSRRIMDNAYFKADGRDQKKIFQNVERVTQILQVKYRRWTNLFIFGKTYTKN